MRVFVLAVFLALPIPVPGGFVPPDETGLLFRRDLLPIDTDTMRALSAQLTELARRKHGDEPAQLRATAQLLAVASRLDPVNQRAREIARRLTEGQDYNPAEPEALRRAKAETWHLVDWLLHEKAGPEGNRLGHQILDALHVIDVRHPSAARHQPGGEQARWEGVVAPLAEFRSAKDRPPEQNNREPKSPPRPDPQPTALASHPPPPVLLRSTKLLTPFLTITDDDQQEPAINQLSLEIKGNELAVRFEFDLLPGFPVAGQDASSLPTRIGDRVRAALLAQWKALPPKNTAVIRTDPGRYASRNNLALAGPAALAVHAAFAGRPLRDELVFIGTPEDDGSLLSPDAAWELLSALRRGPGGRLLVPPDITGHLRALLALREPDFFVKYEVLTVSSLETALLLGAVDGEPDGLIEANALFQEIRRIAATKPIAELAANPHVQERLKAIRDAAPYHLSSRMLLLQGSGQRPTRLELPTLQAELIRCLAPMNALLEADSTKLSAQTIALTLAECRKRLDPLGAYVDPRHGKLREEALGLANTLGALGRLRKEEESFAAYTALHIQLQAKYREFLNRLGSSGQAGP